MTERGNFGGFFTPEGAEEPTEPMEPVDDPSGASQVYPHQGGPEYVDAAELEVTRHDDPAHRHGIPPEDV